MKNKKKGILDIFSENITRSNSNIRSQRSEPLQPGVVRPKTGGALAKISLREIKGQIGMQV